MKTLTTWLLAALLLSAAGWSAWQARQAAWQSAAAAENLTQRLAIMEKLGLKGKKLLEAITFSWYDGYSETMNELAGLRDAGTQQRQRAMRQVSVFIALVLLTLVIYAMHPRAWLLLTLLGQSLIALVAGLLTPVFSLVAFKEFPVLGQTLFQYESKSILGGLHDLWSGGQSVLAAVILLFTVLVPMLKTGLMAVVLAGVRWRGSLWARRWHRFMLHLGKWSMLDVFVVAIVVSWFSLRDKGSTDAQLQSGIFFFLIYVLLSMVIAVLTPSCLRWAGERPLAESEA